MNLQDNIDKMKLELAEMEKQLQTEKQIELQYGVWHMTSRGHVKEYMAEIDSFDATNLGLRRATRVLATEMRDKVVTSSQIEARARELDPDWVADWGYENIQQKYFIFYINSIAKYGKDYRITAQNIGTPCMSCRTADQICKELNEGRFVLGYKE